jgi:hypothetical protein
VYAIYLWEAKPQLDASGLRYFAWYPSFTTASQRVHSQHTSLALTTSALCALFTSLQGAIVEIATFIATGTYSGAVSLPVHVRKSRARCYKRRTRSPVLRLGSQLPTFGWFILHCPGQRDDLFAIRSQIMRPRLITVPVAIARTVRDQPFYCGQGSGGGSGGPEG